MPTSIIARAYLSAATAALFAVIPVTALAAGTVLIQQRDGATKTYLNVRIAIGADAMALTSADGQGTVVIGKSACTKIGELIRCLPYDATLYQHGQTTHIALKSGTVWLNPTGSPQPLTASSAQLPSHGVLMSINTKAGTYVSLIGTADEVKK